MKKSYIEPIVLVEDFCLNENIAACEVIIDREELEWMPNYNDAGDCSVICSYLAIDAWIGTLLS